MPVRGGPLDREWFAVAENHCTETGPDAERAGGELDMLSATRCTSRRRFEPLRVPRDEPWMGPWWSVAICRTGRCPRACRGGRWGRPRSSRACRGLVAGRLSVAAVSLPPGNHGRPITGPSGRASRYCWYRPSSRLTTVSCSRPSSTKRAVPSALTHRKRCQSEAHSSTSNLIAGRWATLCSRRSAVVRLGLWSTAIRIVSAVRDQVWRAVVVHGREVGMLDQAETSAALVRLNDSSVALGERFSLPGAPGHDRTKPGRAT